MDLHLAEVAYRQYADLAPIDLPSPIARQDEPARLIREAERQEQAREATAAAAYADAANALAALRDPINQGAALAKAGAILLEHGSLDKAAQKYQDALNLLIGTGTPIEARCHLNLGILLERMDRGEDALPHYQEALSVAEAAGDTITVGRALPHLAVILVHLGRTSEAVPMFRTAVDRHRSLGDHHREALALSALAGCLGKLGDAPASKASARNAVRLFRRLNLPEREAVALSQLAEAERQQHNLHSARVLLQHALHLEERSQAALLAALTTMSLGYVLEELGLPQRATKAYEDGLLRWQRIAHTLDDTFRLERLLIPLLAFESLARVAVARHRTTEARAYLYTALRITLASREPTAILRAALGIADFEALHGDVTAAALSIEQAIQVAERDPEPVPDTLIWVLTGAAAITRKQRDLEKSHDYLQRASRLGPSDRLSLHSRVRLLVERGFHTLERGENAHPILEALSPLEPELVTAPILRQDVLELRRAVADAHDGTQRMLPRPNRYARTLASAGRTSSRHRDLAARKKVHIPAAISPASTER